MPLTMKLDQTPDMGGRYRYAVRSGGLVVGTIQQVVDGPSAGAWQWGVTLHTPPPDFVGHGLTDTLDEAKDRFRAAWGRWLQWAALQEVPNGE